MSREKTLRKRLGKYLRIKKEYVNLILSGKKRSTIRLGIISPTRHKV
ncbi:MAG TPA: ASCH domain-containing protein, partial [Thermofilum sp.]|nr:ASCH domain-containing protein [Thermofilum sp.]